LLLPASGSDAMVSLLQSCLSPDAVQRARFHVA
jgi:hypothetical protein